MANSGIKHHLRLCNIVICDDILKVYDPKKKKKVVFFGCYFCLLTVKFSESEIAPLLTKNYHTYVDGLRWNFWMFRLEKTMYILIVIYKKSYKNIYILKCSRRRPMSRALPLLPQCT